MDGSANCRAYWRVIDAKNSWLSATLRGPLEGLLTETRMTMTNQAKYDHVLRENASSHPFRQLMYPAC